MHVVFMIVFSGKKDWRCGASKEASTSILSGLFYSFTPDSSVSTVLWLEAGTPSGRPLPSRTPFMKQIMGSALVPMLIFKLFSV